MLFKYDSWVGVSSPSVFWSSASGRVGVVRSREEGGEPMGGVRGAGRKPELSNVGVLLPADSSSSSSTAFGSATTLATTADLSVIGLFGGRGGT
jgi:hypothetical protein